MEEISARKEAQRRAVLVVRRRVLVVQRRQSQTKKNHHHHQQKMSLRQLRCVGYVLLRMKWSICLIIRGCQLCTSATSARERMMMASSRSNSFFLVHTSIHLFFRVLIFPSTTLFTLQLDDDGNHTYCAWCGDGGEMVCCESCIHVFCHECIETLGEEYFTAVLEAQSWNCLVCDPKPLNNYASFYTGTITNTTTTNNSTTTTSNISSSSSNNRSTYTDVIVIDSSGEETESEDMVSERDDDDDTNLESFLEIE